MQIVSVAKEHPGVVLFWAAAGMVVGPWVLGTVRGLTGVSVGLPRVGGGGNSED